MSLSLVDHSLRVGARSWYARLVTGGQWRCATRNSRGAVVLLSALLAHVSPIDAVAQPTAAFSLGAPTLLPDSLQESRGDGRFELSVRRKADNLFDQRLIELAERILPPTQQLVSSARSSAERSSFERASTGRADSLSAVLPIFRSPGDPTERWWTDQFDGTWLPYALTGSAVHYYISWTRDIAERALSRTDTSGGYEHRARMSYVAKVSRVQEYGAQRLVQLDLQWSFECGLTCGIEFRHTRHVWFDREGHVVRVEGDRRPRVTVS